MATDENTIDPKWIAAQARLEKAGVEPIDFAKAEDKLRTAAPDEIKIIETSASIERQIIATIQAEQNAEKDPLTKLLNRRGYEKEMERLQKAAEHHNEHHRRSDSPNVHEPFSMIFIDIDHFKRINDTYGHHAGDQVLAELSKRIKDRIRTGDLAARFGGEEFAVVTMASNGSTTKVAEDLRRLIEEKPFIVNVEGKELVIPATISLGISVYNPDTKTMEQQADAALYKAKGKGEPEGTGRNRIFYNNGKTVELYDPTLQTAHATGEETFPEDAVAEVQGGAGATHSSRSNSEAPPASGQFETAA